MSQISPSQLIEWLYKKHENIQNSEDKRIGQISNELHNLDKTALQFEQRLDTMAEEFEKWIQDYEEKTIKRP
ncbi:hypothetical protein [Metabacillus malikii]|uniref:DNA anti-recombination protein RmuC n=1 Tax=Metabacillus malikii TaxID=1504265 RepID=A0ABT9ZFS6_9BACI|nr:hypothetical protein [Metabacillus malikii]MDQ0230646.1 DNA anti-recombination protein RmuC [Metabacillus malikii]